MRRAATSLVAVLSLGATGLGAAAATPAAPEPRRVIVQAASADAAAAAVLRAGGHVRRVLPVVDAVAADVPVGAELVGVVVTPDAHVRPQEADGPSGASAKNVFRQEIHATDVGRPRTPVTVALIDTGINTAVGGLADNVLSVPDPRTEGGAPVACANFSSESSCDDTYGHGTFLAGLIAGDGPYPGVDRDAKLVSLKIAGRNGSADTSSLLAAIQYVVDFREQLGIKVLNLSLGTDSTHDYRADPLNRAVEKAWQAGITVVVSASNRGDQPHTVSKPGDDPLVITVGAVDDHGTATNHDDTAPAFTGRGPVVEGSGDDTVTVYKPDVAAPGVGLVGLVSPGSHIEQTAGPSSADAPGYRYGSGTSQSAAVVSGAVALLLERRSLTPDEVKAALYVGATRMSAPSSAVGAGVVDVEDALRAGVEGYRQPTPRQDALAQDLDPTRGSVQVSSFACSTLRLQLDADGCTVVAGGLVALGTTRSTLVGPQPELLPFDVTAYGQSWYGQSWYSTPWVQGQSWYGQSWYGQSWYGQSWYEQEDPPPPSSPVEGTATRYGVVLPGSAWYGVWH